MEWVGVETVWTKHTDGSDSSVFISDKLLRRLFRRCFIDCDEDFQTGQNIKDF